METPDQLNKATSNTEICSCEKLTKNVKKEETICLETDGKDLFVIKISYDSYIPLVVSQKVDCKSRVCKNTPGHLHIVSLI